MASDLAAPLLTLAAGAALGAVFFGGLWLTVARVAAADHPLTLTLGSFVGRLAVLGVAFYCIVPGPGGRERLAGLLLGFLGVRALVVGRLRRALPATGGAGATTGGARAAQP